MKKFKKTFKKAAAFLSAAVLGISSLTGSLTASAEQSGVTIGYTWNSSLNPTLKNAKNGTSSGVSGSKLKAGEQIVRFQPSTTDDWAFCIEPGKSMQGTSYGDWLVQSGFTEYDTFDLSNENMTESIRYWNSIKDQYEKHIGLVQYYGYGSHKKDGNYFTATQCLIWEMLLGYRGHNYSNFSKCSDALYNDFTYPKNGWCTADGTEKAYKEIVNKVTHHRDLPSNSLLKADIKRSQAKPALMKYNISTMRYEAAVTVPSNYVDPNSIEHNFSDLKSALEKLIKKEFTGTYGTDYGIATSTNGSNTTYTIWSKTRQFTQGVKTTEAVKMKVKSGIAEQAKLFAHNYYQTCLISTQIDPVSAYVSIAAYNEPNFTISKIYTDSKGNPITGVSLVSMLNDTDFTVSTVINGKTYYVIADLFKSGENGKEYNFSSYTDDQSKATKIKAIPLSDGTAGKAVIYDLPTAQTGGRKYTVTETNVPKNYDKQSKDVTLNSPVESNYSTNPNHPTVSINNKEYSAEWGNVTLNKEIVDVTTEFAGLTTLQKSEKLAAAMAQTEFVVGYKDGNTIRYFTSGSEYPYQACPQINKLGESTNGLTWYPYYSGNYYLPISVDDNHIVTFNQDKTTTDITKAFHFKPCAQYNKTTGELDENFGRIFLDFAELDNGKAKSLIFIEVQHGKGFSYNSDDLDNSEILTYGSNEFLSSLSGDKGHSGLVKGLGMSITSPCNPYVVTTGNGRNTYGSLVNKSANFNLNITKEGTNGEPVQGAEFALYSGRLSEEKIKDAVPLEKAVSDENGNVNFTSVLGYSNGIAQYTYCETSAPKGYVRDTSIRYIMHGSASGSSTTAFTNAYEGVQKSSITNGYHTLNLNIHKTDPKNNVAISGIIFDVKDNSGKVVATLTTDRNGNASVSDLPLGKLDPATNKFEISYTVTEKSDDDYKMVDSAGNIIDTFNVEVTGDDIVDDTTVEVGYTANVNNYLSTVDLKVYKVDDLNKPVKGAKFDIRPTSDIVIKGNTLQKKGETVGTITTDENGYGSSTYVEYEGSQGYTKSYTIYAGYEYELVETFTPEPYVKPESSTKLKADKSNKTLIVPLEVSVVNETQKGDIKVYKVDAEDNKKYLEGAEFAISCKDTVTVNGVKYEASKTIATITTDKNGYAAVTDLPVNHEYVLTETKSPDGYVLSGDTTVQLSYNGELKYVETSVTVKNKATEVHLSKKAITGDDELPGAKLQILDGETVVEEWTSTDKPHIIKGVLTAGKTYILHEEIAPAGYVVANDIQFTVNSDGTANVVEMEDDTTKVHIEKIDARTEKIIAGAVMQILDGESVVEEWTSTDAAHQIEAKLTANKEYVLHEVSAPAGYTKASDIKFTVSSDGSIDKIVMEDKPTEVHFSKKSITGDDELPGASLKILDGDNVIDSWVSTDKPHEILAKLVAGKTYILHEEIAPMGYVVANDIEFTVSEDGSIDLVEMKDDTTKVEIAKYDADTGNILSGAVLQILDGENVVEEWISSEEPHRIEAKLIAGKEYVLHEVSAPEHYLLSEDLPFTISTDGRVDKIEMSDLEQRGNVEIHKTSEEMKNVEGIKFILTGTSNFGYEVNREVITDENGIALFEHLPVGNYTVTEDGETVPAAYITAEKFDVSVTYNETTVKEVYNEEKTGSVQIKKHTEGELNISGITFILSGTSESGREIEVNATTDENGTAVFNNIPIGSYVVKEDESSVAYAYLIADEQSAEVEYAAVNELEFYNAEKTGVIEVSKSTAENKNISGITFILSGTSDSGREIVVNAVTDENGKAIFENIPIGTYEIYEDGKTVPYGYLVAELQKVTVMYAETVDVKFLNQEKTGEIAVHKTTEGMKNVEGITFILSGTSDTGREIKLTAVTDKNGIAKFENIPIGTYTVSEDGSTVPYGYLVSEPQTVKVMYAETVDPEFINKEQTGTVKIQKRTEGMTDISGIKFILKGTSDTGREINISAVTDKDGIATFENIPIGTYEIYEDGSSVPYGYLVADAQSVTVSNAETSNLTFENKKIPEEKKPEIPTTPNVNTGAKVGGTLSIITLSAAVMIMFSRKRKRED